ncbi:MULTISPECIES: hypothetical protein [Pseudomonas]|uniref:hypothetical protein n=1 Tax=Pseudomonas TaxID=286 RepID=UPI00058FF1B4|nr:hypothetical protein [Pseudomonas massiliensis]
MQKTFAYALMLAATLGLAACDNASDKAKDAQEHKENAQQQMEKAQEHANDAAKENAKANQDAAEAQQKAIQESTPANGNAPAPEATQKQ